MVKHLKRIQHVFLVLDARKCWMKNLFWKKFHPTPSNIIFFFFYEMLDEIDAFKRIQHFVHHRKFCHLDEMLDPFKSALRKGVLRNFVKLTGKHLCQSLSFNKVAGLMSATLLKWRLWHRCFSVNFTNFLRTPFLQNTSGRLLLLFG